MTQYRNAHKKTPSAENNIQNTIRDSSDVAPSPRTHVRRSFAEAIVLGCFFSCAIVFGYSYDQANNASLIFDNFPLAAVALICIALVLSCIFEALFRAVDYYNFQYQANHDMDDKLKWGKRPVRRIGKKRSLPDTLLTFPLCTVVLILCWIPWLISVYPGSTDADTQTQLLQIYGYMSASDHHPWFDTLVFAFFWNIGSALGSLSYGLALYALIQMIGMAIGFSLAVTYLRKWGCPEVVRAVFFLFVALFPLFPVFGAFMAKDTLSAAFWLPWFILFIDVVRTKGAQLENVSFACVFFLLALLCCLTKKTCVYVLFIVAVFLVFWVRNPLKIRCAATFIATFFLFGIWTYAVLPAAGIASGESYELMSIPSQQIARYACEYELTEEEQQGIGALYSVDAETLALAYDPRRADYTKRYFVGGDISEMTRFFKTYVSLFLKHPGVFIAATWNNTYDYFYPAKTIMISTWPGVESHYIDDWTAQASKGTSREDIEALVADLTTEMERLKENPSLLRQAYVASADAPVISFLYTEALYCSWIPLLYLGYVIRRRQDTDAGLLLVLPALLVLLTYIAGPISLPRYMPSAVVSGPILITLLFCFPHKTHVHTQAKP